MHMHTHLMCVRLSGLQRKVEILGRDGHSWECLPMMLNIETHRACKWADWLWLGVWKARRSTSVSQCLPPVGQEGCPGGCGVAEIGLRRIDRIERGMMIDVAQDKVGINNA